MTPAPEALIHAFDQDPAIVAVALRVARNAKAELPDAIVRVVVQGLAVSGVLRDGGLDDDIADTLARGVEIVACGNSLSRAHLEPTQLADGVRVVPSAVAHLAERQWAGAAYIRV